MNEIVVDDMEVRPMAVDSVEFDDAGEATLSFVAIKPGSYRLAIPETVRQPERHGHDRTIGTKAPRPAQGR